MLKTAINAEWRTLDKAVEAKRTQGRPNATREEKIDPGTQPKPEEATTPSQNTHGVGGAEDGHQR